MPTMKCDTVVRSATNAEVLNGARFLFERFCEWRTGGQEFGTMIVLVVGVDANGALVSIPAEHPEIKSKDDHAAFAQHVAKQTGATHSIVLSEGWMADASEAAADPSTPPSKLSSAVEVVTVVAEGAGMVHMIQGRIVDGGQVVDRTDKPVTLTGRYTGLSGHLGTN